ncbi:hypothetical protein [Streptomyces sp. NPDC020983]|uniref:hypothetical protein n=1 Tax=Streptomyces sp. NPDC020983 TaxID=3365106 RepID=UPI00379831BA
MARTAVAYSTLSTNSNLSDPAGTSVSSGAGNGGQVAKAAPELTLIRLSNASGGSGTATLLAGTYPPALAAGQGNLVVTVANSGTQWIGPIESGRFLQSDGSLIVETSVAMTMTAFKVPRH